ncbi:MAG: hypothetical protein AB1451_04295 [Nitrospirota bacterium]
MPMSSFVWGGVLAGLFTLGYSKADQNELDVPKLLKRVQHIAENMPVEYWGKSDIMSRVGSLHLRAGEKAAGDAAFEQAIAVILAADDLGWYVDLSLDQDSPLRVPRKVVSLIEIARLRSELGDSTGAAATLEKAVEQVGELQDVIEKVGSLQEVAVAQVYMGDSQAAQSTVDRLFHSIGTMPPDRAAFYQAQALFAVAKSQAQQKNLVSARKSIQRALEIVRRIDEGRLRYVLLTESAKALAMLGDQKTFEEVLETALETRDAADSTYESKKAREVHILSELSEVYGDVANQDMAEQIRRRILLVLGQIEDEEFSPGLLRDISIALARVGKLNAAVQVAVAIEDEMYQTPTLPYIIEAQLRSGDLRCALRWAATLGERDPTRRDELIGRIAAAQAKTGDIESARRTLEAVSNQNTLFRLAPLRAIAAARVRAGEGKEALSWANSFGSKVEEAHVLLGLAEGLLYSRA